MPFSARKTHFFDKNGLLTPAGARRSAPERRCQGTFFSGGILLLISWRILLGKVGHMVKPPAEHFQFSWKWAIFGRFENKSFWKWLEPKTYCVCYPNTLLYMVLDHLWAKKCHNFGQKLQFSIFKKFTFLAVLRGFEGQIEIPRQVLWSNRPW